MLRARSRKPAAGPSGAAPAATDGWRRSGSRDEIAHGDESRAAIAKQPHGRPRALERHLPGFEAAVDPQTLAPQIDEFPMVYEQHDRTLETPEQRVAYEPWPPQRRGRDRRGDAKNALFAPHRQTTLFVPPF